MEENVLYVQVFGGFALEWNGKRIIGEKSKESQVSYLLQMVLHFRSEGVSREEIKQVIFGERELENVNHALRSVIYNAKKKLRSAGLPEEDYIQQRNGRYYWTEKIPVVEDSRQMECLAREAETSEDPAQRLKSYLEACYTYTGEFLGEQNSTVWAAQEARRYHGLFCRCVEEAAELLRKQKDADGLKALGDYAVRVDPLADWEVLTMEALVAQGKYLEARKFYNDTLELYLREQGFTPSTKMQDIVHKLDKRMQHSYGVLGEIQQELSNEKQSYSGGYLCAYPVFLGIYHMLRRVSEREGQSSYLMLCTVMDSKGKPMEPGAKLEELSERLQESIRYAVRRSDVINRYGHGQYLVLLVNITREDCEVVQRRIDRDFMKNRQRIYVEYHVSSVEQEF